MAYDILLTLSKHSFTILSALDVAYIKIKKTHSKYNRDIKLSLMDIKQCFMKIMKVLTCDTPIGKIQ
jgi:hypothetical protein